MKVVICLDIIPVKRKERRAKQNHQRCEARRKESCPILSFEQEQDQSCRGKAAEHPAPNTKAAGIAAHMQDSNQRQSRKSHCDL